MSTTSIEWTDRVWNPVTGCTKVSQGCKHCYAETIANRKLPHGGFTDRPFTEVRTHEDRLLAPLRWRKPQRVFVNSMSDLFHEDVIDGFIDKVFAVMALSPRHTFQILTKRAERMRDNFADETPEHLRSCIADRALEIAFRVGGPRGDELVRDAKRLRELWERGEGWPLPNVWLGVSAENQATADERIPQLLQTPAAVRFVSAEPLLGPVTLDGWVPKPKGWKWAGGIECRHGYDACPQCDANPTRGLDWVIVGGESGPGARPCDVAWVRTIVQQCQAAAVPVFVKQLGADSRDGIDRIDREDRKGGDPAEWPADLRVREFPQKAGV